MKQLIRLVIAGLAVCPGIATTSGQIAITSSDIGAQVTPGRTTTSRIDTSTKTINIGSLGSTSWNFSALVNSYTYTATTVRPDTTPFFSEYSSATHAYKAGDIYSYYSLGSNYLFLGTAYSTPFDTRVKNYPADVIFQLPMTMGTTWTSTYTDTTRIPSFSITNVTHHVKQMTVDAYGNMTLPGGATYPALRLKTDMHTTQNGITVRLIMYQFMANNGAGVTVVAADTNQPTTGTISVSSISWTGPIIPTSVDEIPTSNLPDQYALAQNYPNPFNPSTRIGFSLPERSFISLKVYDLLGREVAVLLSEELSAGSYEKQWNVMDLPSGMYTYRLQAGEFVATRKLMVMK